MIVTTKDTGSRVRCDTRSGVWFGTLTAVRSIPGRTRYVRLMVAVVRRDAGPIEDIVAIEDVSIAG